MRWDAGSLSWHSCSGSIPVAEQCVKYNRVVHFAKQVKPKPFLNYDLLLRVWFDIPKTSTTPISASCCAFSAGTLRSKKKKRKKNERIFPSTARRNQPADMAEETPGPAQDSYGCNAVRVCINFNFIHPFVGVRSHFVYVPSVPATTSTKLRGSLPVFREEFLLCTLDDDEDKKPTRGRTTETEGAGPETCSA